MKLMDHRFSWTTNPDSIAIFGNDDLHFSLHLWSRQPFRHSVVGGRRPSGLGAGGPLQGSPESSQGDPGGGRGPLRDGPEGQFPGLEPWLETTTAKRKSQSPITASLRWWLAAWHHRLHVPGARRRVQHGRQGMAVTMSRVPDDKRMGAVQSLPIRSRAHSSESAPPFVDGSSHHWITHGQACPSLALLTLQRGREREEKIQKNRGANGARLQPDSPVAFR